MVRWLLYVGVLLLLGSAGVACSMDVQTPPSEEKPSLQQECQSDKDCRRFEGQGGVCQAGRCVCPAAGRVCPTGCSWDASPGCLCVNSDNDPNHCGACNNSCGAQDCCKGRCCAPGAVCCGESCCLVGQTCCEGQCVDLPSSTEHCGQCGDACKAGEKCCKGRCRDVLSNLDHCGACGQVCPTQSCCNGVCCAPGQTCCEGQCLDVRYDAKNCGACGVSCKAGEICCKGLCVDPNSDEHCGACGNRCSRLLPNKSQSQPIREGVDRTLKFVFQNLPKAEESDDLTLTVEVFGDFEEQHKYADVFVGGVPKERIQGGVPRCNWAKALTHSKVYNLRANEVLGGLLKVDVVLSEGVKLNLCESFQSRVVVTLSYGRQTCCNKACIQPKTDPNHCGACGKVCPDKADCCNGLCCSNIESCCQGACCSTIPKLGGWVHQIVAHPTQNDQAFVATSQGASAVVLSGRTIVRTVNTGAGKNTLGVAAHPNGKWIATASDNGEVGLWDYTTSKQIRLFHTFQKAALSVAISPDGSVVAAGTEGGKLFLWDTQTGKNLWEYSLGGTQMTSIVFTPDSKNLFVVAADRFVLLLDLKGTVVKLVNMDRYSSSNVLSIALQPNGTWLVVGVGARELHILDLTNFQPVKVLSHPGEPTVLSFDSTGTYLAVATNDQTVRLWDVKKGVLVQTYFDHQSQPTAVLYHPKTKHIVSGTSTDKKLRVWRAP
ncbi:MAG: hypothetical protein EP343_15190 [Deltaproteobacteria bacterium]|nr:MAG: hypothetical protein EP343_15190 [Deltaproteobacteria bacterium]